MLILAIDTAGDICSVALLDGTRELSSFAFRHERRLTERLPAIVQFLLADYGTRLRDIEAFAVGIGPGSFTGVRVGVTMAKTWALGLDRPVVGVGSLDALAEVVSSFAPGGIVAVAPTRRTEVVAAFYRPATVTPLQMPEVVGNPNVVAMARAAGLQSDPLLVVGEAADAVRLAMADTDGVRFISLSPSALAVGRLAAPRLAQGDVDDTDALTPLYVTPSPVG